jgi:hypothetical protein
MGHAGAERDRRSNHRVDLDGRAVLFQRGDHVGQYALENISAGGALISGARDVRPGHLVHVLIDFATGAETMSLTGSVRRVRTRERENEDRFANGNGFANGNSVGLAISFPVLSADQEDAIHDAVLRALVRRDEKTVRLPLLVFEPRRRVRREIEVEIRSFGLPVMAVDSLERAVSELEGEETQYGGLVIHSVTNDARSMEVVQFFAQSESLRTIILPEPDGTLPERAERLAKLPEVRVPRIWSRSELRRALTD